ncbi:MAG: peptide chain release factor N(5)-glutamine methyltransferase [Sulfuricella sp.]|nr:peptide chain release factor N(5)-glutamine methyltransferase [Sulfuricella sp.]
MTVTLSDILRQSTAALAEALALPLAEARLEAQVLLCRALNQPRAYLAGHDRDPLLPEPAAIFTALFERRLKGEPVAYILGEREFFSLNFKVTPDVLIPRPETELLVELTLARLPAGQPCQVLDLGTGSGAVAIAMAHHRPKAEVLAVDQSAAALAIARENARRLGAGNLRFAQGDWYGALAEEKFDLIVSNPPYIAATDPHLAQGDLRFEPAAALAAGSDGLDDIRVIVQGAPAHLNPSGWLLFEHGYDQAEACRQLLAQAGFSNISSSHDLAGIARVTHGQFVAQI